MVKGNPTTPIALGELIKTLSKYPEDTDIYISTQNMSSGKLLRSIIIEPDGTITLTSETRRTS
ncbi:MAG: hypothetical protein IJ104_00670 [Methanobrevibacter sp.]|nr:hypothetical protein [Methanobrevibacter sp.]MBQ9024882.1 hypothetical protein [Methanobrevibacter sp.]